MAMDASDVTVVIPTYKRPRLLARALESVLQHDEPRLNIHVYDNASGDATESIVKEISGRHAVHYVRHPTNIGGTANFQHAIRSIETRYCAVLNDDDVQLPGLISSALRAFSAHPSAGAYCGRTIAFDDDKKVALGTQGEGWREGFYAAGSGTSPMVREHFTPTGVVFATEALRQARLEFSDSEMMARLAERNDIVVGADIHGAFAVHSGSWTANHSFEEELHRVMVSVPEFLKLKTLTDSDRYQFILRTVHNLAFRAHREAAAKMAKGDLSSETRQQFGRAALLLAALDQQGSSRSVLLRVVKAMFAANAPGQVFRRVWELQRRRTARAGAQTGAHVATPAEEKAVDQIKELDRRAAALAAVRAL